MPGWSAAFLQQRSNQNLVLNASLHGLKFRALYLDHVSPSHTGTSAQIAAVTPPLSSVLLPAPAPSPEAVVLVPPSSSSLLPTAAFVPDIAALNPPLSSSLLPTAALEPDIVALNPPLSSSLLPTGFHTSEFPAASPLHAVVFSSPVLLSQHQIAGLVPEAPPDISFVHYPLHVVYRYTNIQNVQLKLSLHATTIALD